MKLELTIFKNIVVFASARETGFEVEEGPLKLKIAFRIKSIKRKLKGGFLFWTWPRKGILHLQFSNTIIFVLISHLNVYSVQFG